MNEDIRKDVKTILCNQRSREGLIAPCRNKRTSFSIKVDIMFVQFDSIDESGHTSLIIF